MLLSLVEIFCVTDDFCKLFEEEQKNFYLPSKHKRNRACQMTLSEIMTILILFHRSDYRTFKHFYLECVKRELGPYFPKALGYSRFVQLIPQALLPLIIFLSGLKGKETGIYFVDATTLEACHIKRERRHKVFKDVAKRGKTSTGWFFGFKLHLIFNDKGELIDFRLTSGNVDDRAVVEEMVNNLKGWLFGDRGYISQKLNDSLINKGVELITKVKKNMKEKIFEPVKKYYLDKRGMIETIIDQLKNLLQIDHSRHRSIMNFQINVLGGLLAYIFKPRKVNVPFHKINLLASKGMLLTSN